MSSSGLVILVVGTSVAPNKYIMIKNELVVLVPSGALASAILNQAQHICPGIKADIKKTVHRLYHRFHAAVIHQHPHNALWPSPEHSPKKIPPLARSDSDYRDRIYPVSALKAPLTAFRGCALSVTTEGERTLPLAFGSPSERGMCFAMTRLHLIRLLCSLQICVLSSDLVLKPLQDAFHKLFIYCQEVVKTLMCKTCFRRGAHPTAEQELSMNK